MCISYIIHTNIDFDSLRFYEGMAILKVVFIAQWLWLVPVEIIN